MTKVPFLITIPHSGEQIPSCANWLLDKNPILLLRDVDRFVNLLYKPSIEKFDIDSVTTPWSRYAVDLNRFEGEYDQQSVMNAPLPIGTHPRGLHWSMTTHKEILIEKPMSEEVHQLLMEQCFQPFHDAVERELNALGDGGVTYHLDAHSMPSLGTTEHRDPGQQRADVVISDFLGKSCSLEFRELVVEAYSSAGFQVAINWPYMGGGITQRYGRPENSRHAIQVELNRKLYMNESTKEKNDHFNLTQEKLNKAIEGVLKGLRSFTK